jgi:DNA-directed RNA polymerase I subunit RPA2
VRDDETMTLNYLKYRKDGTTVLSFQKYEISSIMMLKAFKQCTDKEIFESILGAHATSVNIDRVMTAIKSYRNKHPHLDNPNDIYSLLGKQFGKTAGETEQATGRRVANRFILPHLKTDEAKFDFLVLMIRKLFQYVENEVQEERTESFSLTEAQSAGQVFVVALREAIQQCLGFFVGRCRKIGKAIDLESKPTVESELNKVMKLIQPTVKACVSAGNLKGASEFPSLVQATGLSLIAERISYYRYLSHFRSIHKGARFGEMRTTDMRKLTPEEWGFVCPVHTPDGGPCGLLNHLGRDVVLIVDEDPSEHLPALLASLGMSPIQEHIRVASISPSERVTVFLNGTIIGYVRSSETTSIANQLRYMKVKGLGNVPKNLEIAPFTSETVTMTFPGLFLSTHAHRLVRPVRNLVAGDEIEYISPMEQLSLNIACTHDDIRPTTTHMELSPTAMLSTIGSLTPFSDFNQSPRNIYQCQMGKQTMAFPLYNFPSRSDNKLYRLLVPQKPIVRTEFQEKFPFNAYANGTNAIVAVISYTGYDMEDAMIVNKSSYERGFGHANMYKTEEVSLPHLHNEFSTKDGGEFPVYFANYTPQGTLHCPELDEDGLPRPGTVLRKGDPVYCVFNDITGQFQVKKYKETDSAIVDNVKLANIRSSDPHATYLNPNSSRKTKAVITLRFDRNPTIGDKFSSRHGQKGIMSLLWPTEDMPFSENGMSPDVIINPHAFPSRMTIGMLVESMAGKSGALHGYYVDATPFQFDEKNQPVDYFGEQLRRAGYNYYGNETLYSGTTGVEMKCEIYMGVVYYQRLRHMVSDKFQARANTGPIDRITRQPMKGRKIGGGIRFGEMERDALLGYGASNVLRDRMLVCSDLDQATLCRQCGNLISVVGLGDGGRCAACNGKDLGVVEIPYPLRYLNAELASMNIRMKLHVKDS